ncbi:hypothetical protein DINM_003057 [Dirofilaria immitis]|nr:hypothetical protein [Dirofilaria immitis]
MSTISSNADINTKYQRVAAEYAKLKAQISTLKNAVIAEQAKNEKLSNDLHNSESALRKLESEKEGFEFRNSQLVKRVESLQNEIDSVKHKSVKKRGLIFQKNARTERSFELENEVLQMELQKKVVENETLHKKISELENEYTETTSILNEQYRNLEIENGKLKEELRRIETNIATDQTLNCDMEKQSKIQLAAENMSVILSAEEAVAMKETLQVLWLDALRIAKMLAAGFANLLQLFEQRSTIYPNDSNMEKLPDRTLLYGCRLLSSCDMFEACSSSIENILVKTVDDDCNLSAECSKITSVITEALHSCEEWQELFCESGANENQSPLELFTLVEKLRVSLADCGRAYTAKIFNENRIPTATKRLCCVNECISSCLTSLHRNLNRFVALVQLIMNSSHLKEENIVPQNTKVESPSLVSAPPNSDIEVLISKNDDEAEHEERQSSKNKCAQSATDFWKSEIELATKRIIELEKEKSGSLSPECGTAVSEFSSKDADVICSYFEERIGDLHADIQYTRSRAYYYKHECKDLLKLAKLSKQENEALREELNCLTAREAELKEELETTRKSYEMQLQSLHEHIANLNTKLDEQSKALNSFKDVLNGVTSTKQTSRKPLLK